MGKPAIQVGVAVTAFRRLGSSPSLAHTPDLASALLIQRGKAPNLGLWALPGGRLHFGESLVQAAIREFREETQLELLCPADASSVFTITEAILLDEGFHYVLAHVTGIVSETAAPIASDDAAACAWVPVAPQALDRWRRGSGFRTVPQTEVVLERAVLWWTEHSKAGPDMTKRN